MSSRSDWYLTKTRSVAELAALLPKKFRFGVTADSSTCELDPEEPAEITVTRMAGRLIDAARLFEQGLLEDIDTEFVHQYRVNIRKTRSLLGLFKKVLSSQRYQLLKTELKTLGNRTNSLRDLDVFLLHQDYYRGMLPAQLRPGLQQVFNRVRRRRALVLSQVRKALRSEQYQKQVNQVLKALRQQPEYQTKQSKVGIKALVGKKILAQYQHIAAAGALIDDETPDKAVHELRIECKKLRYLLELFAELYPKKKLKQLIGRLKGLQNNLGRHNDYSVQREFILGFGRGKTISAEQLASINGLAAVLFNQQLQERKLLVKNISVLTAERVGIGLEQLVSEPVAKEPD